MRFAVLIACLSVLAPGLVHGGERLTLQECVDKALANHPGIRAARESLNAGKGRATQAASPYQPQVRASTGYAESHAAGGAFGDTITKSYTTTLSASQVLYDFGKTRGALDAAKLGVRSAETDVERTMQETVLGVKQAYFALLQAGKLLTVAERTLAQTESHLARAEAFFRAGSRPRFDVTRAEVDVNNARLGLINAKNEKRIRTIGLYHAMGVDPAGDLDVEDVLADPSALPSLKQAEAEALKDRPEMQKAESDIEAAKAAVKAERSNYLPTLSAAGEYNWANGTTEMGTLPGANFPLRGEVGNSWNAGVTLSAPLYEGGLTRGRVGEALANQRSLEAQRDLLRQALLLEVHQAYADLEGASARIIVMESSLKTARESLELAEGRYGAGVGPSIEVTDAQVAAVKAETDYVQALYDYQLAVARLFKAMGRRE